MAGRLSCQKTTSSYGQKCYLLAQRLSLFVQPHYGTECWLTFAGSAPASRCYPSTSIAVAMLWTGTYVFLNTFTPFPATRSDAKSPCAQLANVLSWDRAMPPTLP
ncbi:hypothetical protein FRC12_024919 [Ceratobasidium sp. 428]|nr:hypothetical protein FRC12_024919 [Ceratobasidium sp. 428]